jgi:hypothetical protein
MTLRTNYNDNGATQTPNTVTAADLNAISSAVNSSEQITNKNIGNGYLGADANGKLALTSIDATGTPTSSTVLLGSGAWSSTLTSPTLVTPTITGYTETVNALGTVTTSKTIPALSNGTVMTATLTASTACTFTMPTAVAGQSFTLLLKQAATTGAGTAAFTSVKWSAAGTPTQTATAATMDIYTFVSDGTDWYGSYSQGYVP